MMRTTPRTCLIAAWLVGFALTSQALAHPSLYFQAADLASLQARSQDDGINALGYDFASVFQKLAATADNYRSSPCTYSVQIPNSDGSGTVAWSYTVSANLPPPHPNNPSYPPWTGLARLIQRRIETMAFVYALTGDSTYLTNADGYGALDTALAVASWSQWTDPGYACGGRTCLDTAHLTMGIAMVYDLAFEAMTQAERDQLRNALVNLGIEPLAADVSDANQSGSASNWFNGYALRVTGLAVGAAAVAEDVGAGADPWLTLARNSVEFFFASQGTDGGTFEGQLYGSYALDELVVAAQALDSQGIGTGLFQNSWLTSLPEFTAAFLGSDNHSMANFGDSSEPLHWANTMFALAAHGDAMAQWFLQVTGEKRPGSPLQFIWANPDLPAQPLDGSGTRLFRDVGHAALRSGFSGNPVVAVKSGPPTVDVGHNHYDQNSFIINAYGEWIAADPGYRNYFNAAKRTYTTQSVGHNTIMVDKTVAPDGSSVQGGQVHRTGGTLDFLLDGHGYAKVVGQAAAAYESGLLTRFGRRIFYAKPDLVFLFDDLASPQAHEFSFLLHAPPSGSIETGDKGPAEMVLYGNAARLQAFLVSSSTMKSGYPAVQWHPGAEEYGPYAEWRTSSTRALRLAAAFVPGKHPHTEFANPGFEDGLANWTPRFQDGTHAADDGVARSGTRSARISFDTSRGGYFYSEPISVLPSASIEAQISVRAEATGSVRIQFYWMKDGAYIDDPAGESASLDPASATGWTILSLSSTVPATGVDAVRLALIFNGTGTVWFDDAQISLSPTIEPTAFSHAVALVRESGVPAGLAVKGPFGVDAAASLVGSDQSGEITLQPSEQDIPEVSSISSDGSLFCLGLTPSGELKRAYLQGGSFLTLGDTPMVTASGTGSFDLAISRDENGCATLFLTQVPTLEAPPYRVRSHVDQIFLDGQRTAFVQQGDEVVFPQGSDMGPGCEGGQPSQDGGLDATAGDAGPDATGGDAHQNDDAGPAEQDHAASGCGCSTGRNDTGLPFSFLLILLVFLPRLIRQSRSQRP